MNAEKTGALIKQLRLNKNLTQLQLAELVNVSDKAVSKWERGDGCPDITILPKLAEVLCVEMESLMEGAIPKTQDVSGMTIKDYNFRQPDVYPAHMQKDVVMMGEELRKKINKSFTAILNERCEFAYHSIDQMTNIEFLRSVPKTCFFYDFEYSQNGFCIELDAELGKMLLKQDAQKYSSITEFDLDVVKNYFVKEIAALLGQEIIANTNDNIDEKHFTISKVRSSSNTNNTNQEENWMMLLLTFKCNIGGKESFMNIQFSAGLLEEMSIGGFFTEGPSSKIKFQVLSNIKDKQQPDNIFVEFGRFRADNVTLEYGKILILDKKETEGLNVVYKNKVIHTGKTIVADENYGVQILESHQLNEIVYDEDDYISIQLGTAALSEEQVNGLHQGSYILLNQLTGDPCLILRAGKVVATGEVVICDNNFGIRIIETK